MTNKPQFSGVGVALVTPFTASGAIDFTALTSLVEHVSRGGVDYLVVMGTTAESPTLSSEEKQQILSHIIKNNPEKLPIVYGIGGNNTAEVVQQLRTTDLCGVSAILSVVPYYNKPNQEGIYRHYAEVLKASFHPVILYNIPGRTGVNMSVQTTLRLANDFPGKAIGVKEASGNLNQMTYILRDRPAGFAVISGDDNLTLPLVALGGDGIISVSANAFPEKFCSMVHLAQRGETAQAARLNLELHGVTDLLFEEGNPVGVKAALHHKKIMGKSVRLPLVEVSDSLSGRIIAQIEHYGLK